jgi:hypothetical protein
MQIDKTEKDKIKFYFRCEAHKHKNDVLSQALKIAEEYLSPREQQIFHELCVLIANRRNKRTGQ